MARHLLPWASRPTSLRAARPRPVAAASRVAVCLGTAAALSRLRHRGTARPPRPRSAGPRIALTLTDSWCTAATAHRWSCANGRRATVARVDRRRSRAQPAPPPCARDARRRAAQRHLQPSRVVAGSRRRAEGASAASSRSAICCRWPTRVGVPDGERGAAGDDRRRPARSGAAVRDRRRQRAAPTAGLRVARAAGRSRVRRGGLALGC